MYVHQYQNNNKYPGVLHFSGFFVRCILKYCSYLISGLEAGQYICMAPDYRYIYLKLLRTMRNAYHLYNHIILLK